MAYLLVFLSVSFLVLVYMWFEAGFVQISRLRFAQNKENLKILHLSDIHINLLRVSPLKVKKIIDNENPDIILMSGDYITRPKHIPKFLKFIDTIKKHNNMYICLGNHDYEAFAENNSLGLENFLKQLESRGITVLNNRAVLFEKNNKEYNIIGIADYRRGGYDIDKALGFCKSTAALNIAFSHNPDVVLEVPEGKLDYMLCGHFHGGQIWLPLGLEFKVLRNEKLCKKGIRRGLHKVNGINLYINRGLGNVLLPLRLFSRPEIAVIYLP
jgi:predicted MPP superfamily phosphohydrolase